MPKYILILLAALVCFAVREEARFFSAPAHPATRPLITGMGRRRASGAIRAALSCHRPRLVLTCGFAGGLNPALPLGQVVCDDTQAGPFQNTLNGPGILKGRFVHSDRVVVSAADKAQLRQASGGDAVEMESSAIVAACHEQGLPVIVLRVISDTATEDLPMDFNRFSRSDGSLSLPRLLLGVARSPAAIPRLIAFQGRLREAARNLALELQRYLTADDLF